MKAGGILPETRRFVDRETAGVHPRLANARRNEGFAGDRDVVADRELATDSHLPADHAALTDRRAAGDTRLPRHDGVRTDMHVVGDVHLIVELHAVADHGVLDRAAIDRALRADLDIVADADRADLRDFHPRAAVRRKAEAVGADDDAGMQDAAVADHDVGIDGDVRDEPGVGADARTAHHDAS